MEGRRPAGMSREEPGGVFPPPRQSEGHPPRPGGLPGMSREEPSDLPVVGRMPVGASRHEESPDTYQRFNTTSVETDVTMRRAPIPHVNMDEVTAESNLAGGAPANTNNMYQMLQQNSAMRDRVGALIQGVYSTETVNPEDRRGRALRAASAAVAAGEGSAHAQIIQGMESMETVNPVVNGVESMETVNPERIRGWSPREEDANATALPVSRYPRGRVVGVAGIQGVESSETINLNEVQQEGDSRPRGISQIDPREMGFQRPVATSAPPPGRVVAPIPVPVDVQHPPPVGGTGTAIPVPKEPLASAIPVPTASATVAEPHIGSFVEVPKPGHSQSRRVQDLPADPRPVPDFTEPVITAIEEIVRSENSQVKLGFKGAKQRVTLLEDILVKLCRDSTMNVNEAVKKGIREPEWKTQRGLPGFLDEFERNHVDDEDNPVSPFYFHQHRAMTYQAEMYQRRVEAEGIFEPFTQQHTDLADTIFVDRSSRQHV